MAISSRVSVSNPCFPITTSYVPGVSFVNSTSPFSFVCAEVTTVPASLSSTVTPATDRLDWSSVATRSVASERDTWATAGSASAKSSATVCRRENPFLYVHIEPGAPYLLPGGQIRLHDYGYVSQQFEPARLEGQGLSLPAYPLGRPGRDKPCL